MKVVILRDDVCGEITADVADTLLQAKSVSDELKKNPEWEVIELPFGDDMAKNISNLKLLNPDLVFNLVESSCSYGRLSTMATEILSCLKINFTGNPSYAHLISADKSLAKKLMIEHNIPTPRGYIAKEVDKLGSEFPIGLTYIIKARSEHASIGIDKDSVFEPIDLSYLQDKIKYYESKMNGDCIIEQFIDGKEYNVAILAGQVLPPAEMCFDSSFDGYKVLTYDAKWSEESDDYCLSQRSFDIPKSISDNLSKIALDCWNKLGLKGYARVDFRADNKDNLYVIDINTNPCISPDAGFAAMADKAGMNYNRLVQRIADDALVS